MRSWQKVSSRVWACAAMLVLTGALVAGCGGSGSSNPAEQGGGKIDAWMTPNGDIWNHREANSEITTDNVDELAVAWKLPITASLDNTFVPAAKFGYFASTPVFDGKGHVFLQDAANNVTAVEVETGAEVWKAEFNEPNEGPNGVTYNDGRIYGCTSTVCFALDAETGEEIWKSERLVITEAEGEEAFPLAEEVGGNIDTTTGITAAGQGINFAPQVAVGKVFVSTSGQITGGEAIALDAASGKVLWKRDETFKEEDRAVGGVAGTGGSWNAPAVAPDGTVYYGIGNPYRTDTQAIETPRHLLYNDSTIALDPESGKVNWYFQAVPNDFYDWDMQISPVFAEVGGKEVILDAGKMGEVFGMEAGSGELLWRTKVGTHNGHNEDGLKAINEEYEPKKYPYKVYPGTLGGVETNMAYSEEDEVAYTATVNSYQERPDPNTTLGGGQELSESTGDMTAIDVKTGGKLWETELPQVPFGAATIANDLVFTTLYDGTIIALDREDGEIVWEEKLPGGTNSPLVVEGGTLIAVNSVPTGEEKPQVVAYRLGAIEAEVGANEAEGGAPEAAEAEPGPAEEAVAEARANAEAKEAGGEPEEPITYETEAESEEGTEEAEGEGESTEEEEGEEEAAAGGGEASEAMLTEGKTAFTTNCASCHTLSEAGTSGHVGPDLDELMPEDSLVETQVTNGGGGMPAFGSTLSKTEIEAIAAYVSAVAGTGNDTLGGKTTGGGGGA